jgi:hypothetical protein
MADLLPCPFCASPNPAVLARTCNRDTPYNPMDRAFPEVRCRGCGASVPGDNWGKPESAINAWNTRHSRGSE